MRNWAKTYPVAASVLVVILAMISLQMGGAVAKTMLPALGVAGATALRMAFASIMLMVFWRPWRLRPRRETWGVILIYGASMGFMNLLFYAALNRIPLGITVAIEFTGPLAVALGASRRPLDFLWIALAVMGLSLLLPLGTSSNALDPVGMAFALGAGVCWAIYIVSGKRVGADHGVASAAFGVVIGAILIVPIGIAEDGSRMLVLAVWPVAIAVALLSSALPYSMEMYALRRLPTRSFGVLMSLEPALGALAGLWFLGERLTVLQWAAIGSIMIASGGSAATARS
jgi:inner membrane transporter RhtA